ncbi:MAG: 50S ribosomal protein L18e [archaeon]
MAKKLEMQLLIASLEKLSRKTKKPIWGDLAERLGKPTRHNVVINLFELDKLAKQFSGKTLIVPGKVLATGELTEKAKIVAVQASEKAVATGKVILMKDFLEGAEKIKVSDLIIIK